MKNRSIFFLILLAFTLTQCNLKNAIDQQQAFFRQQAAPFQISKPMVDSTMIRLKTKFREIDSVRMEKGVKQLAILWRPSDGGEMDFRIFCEKYFMNDSSTMDSLFTVLSQNFNSICTDFDSIGFNRNNRLSGYQGSMSQIEKIFAAYDPNTHLSDDFFNNKIAQITMLNFPYYSLSEKHRYDTRWTKREWAFVRMGDVFIARVPFDYKYRTAKVLINSSKYVSNYSINPSCLIDNQGKKHFPEKDSRLSLWDLSYGIRANYAEGEEGLLRQQMLYAVILHILKQDIQDSITYDADITWNPFTNQVYKDGMAVSQDDGPRPRYVHLQNNIVCLKAGDQFRPFFPTYLDRTFNYSLEIPQKLVEHQFKQLCSSPLAKKTAIYISKRLNRRLQAFDIWYNGFQDPGNLDKRELDATTRAKYPNNQSFISDIPNILTRLGFEAAKSRQLSNEIFVDTGKMDDLPWKSETKTESEITISHSILPMLIGRNGMDYQAYSRAMYGLGNAVGNAISQSNIDNFMLKGIPTPAFNTALAFVFQKRSCQSLGKSKITSDETSFATLDAFWNCYASAGAALLEIRIWQWFYKNPAANEAQLNIAVRNLAVEIWNQYYSPVFKIKNSPILAIYPNMIAEPLSLSTNAIGHLVGFQMDQYLNGKNFSEEVIRMFSQGRVTPALWMRRGIQQGISVNSLLRATADALIRTDH